MTREIYIHATILTGNLGEWTRDTYEVAEDFRDHMIDTWERELLDAGISDGINVPVRFDIEIQRASGYCRGMYVGSDDFETEKQIRKVLSPVGDCWDGFVSENIDEFIRS